MKFLKIDPEIIREQLDYDPDTGIFRWKISKRGPCGVGAIAGSLNKQGYRRIKINGRHYLCSRLAWVFTHGVDPRSEIDHENGIHSDDRLANLREATRAQNCANVPASGIRFEPDRKKWLARICVNYKQINLGRFSTEEEARMAYVEACRKHRGDFSRV